MTRFLDEFCSRSTQAPAHSHLLRWFDNLVSVLGVDECTKALEKHLLNGGSATAQMEGLHHHQAEGDMAATTTSWRGQPPLVGGAGANANASMDKTLEALNKNRGTNGHNGTTCAGGGGEGGAASPWRPIPSPTAETTHSIENGGNGAISSSSSSNMTITAASSLSSTASSLPSPYSSSSVAAPACAWAARATAGLAGLQALSNGISNGHAATAPSPLWSSSTGAQGGENANGGWRLPSPTASSNLPQHRARASASGTQEMIPTAKFSSDVNPLATRSKKARPNEGSFAATLAVSTSSPMLWTTSSSVSSSAGSGGVGPLPSTTTAPSPFTSLSNAVSIPSPADQSSPAYGHSNDGQEAAKEEGELAAAADGVVRGQAPIAEDGNTGGKEKSGPAAANFGRYGSDLPYNGRKICRVKGCEGNQRWPDFLCGAHGGGRCRWEGCNLFHQGINSMGLLLCGKHCKALGASYRAPRSKGQGAKTAIAAAATESSNKKGKSKA